MSNTFFLCREIRHEDSFIHVLFLCVFLLYHFVMFFGVYFLPLHSMSSTGAVPKTPAPTPSSSFVADAPIQFDLLTPTSQNGGVAPSLPGPPKLVSKACHHACIMSLFSCRTEGHDLVAVVRDTRSGIIKKNNVCPHFSSQSLFQLLYKNIFSCCIKYQFRN